ncbi:MAG: hypothetical protein ABSD98_12360 [Candidatus Korobacteraceae bacterium]
MSKRVIAAVLLLAALGLMIYPVLRTILNEHAFSVSRFSLSE